MKLLQSALITLLCLAYSASTLTAADQPNIILLMGDDHGWVETGYNGHPYLYTPVLDEMAATGLRLDRFYSGASTCSPTRASFLTGRHPNRSGTFTPNWSTRPEEITIGHLMKQAGYRTAHFGKWHVGTVKADSPLNPGAMGFDEWLSHDNFFELDPVLVRNGGEPKKYPGESSQIIIDETIRFAKEAKKEGKPFMIVGWFGSPHEPYLALPEDLKRYDNLPEKFANQTVSLTSVKTGESVKRPVKEVLQERFAEITAMDRAIGNLRDYLKQAGLRDNTLLFYCGDNGIPSSGNFENPFHGLKGDVYEGGLRVPGLIEWPAVIKEPRISSVNSVTSDLLPTLCDLIGIHPPERPLDGISLKPLLEGKLTERPQPIFFWNYDAGSETKVDREPYIDPVYQEGTTPLIKMMKGKYTRTFENLKHPTIRESDYGGNLAVLSNRYKLVVNGEKDSGIELFDLEKDPYETTDLSEDLPALTTTLQNQMVTWQNSVLHSLTGGDYQ
jgi:arylsulfatase A-like enzyme